MFINAGFGNMVNEDHISVIISPESAPAKRMIQSAKEDKTVIDATSGRRTRSIVILTTGKILLSALLPETIAQRASGVKKEKPTPEEEEAESEK
ncbi:MAG: DUF370 domain-containing protein [Lachnospiraceae bacterium]|nr:DUF370 domain-containing protein [Lachnospiraceae bacterium]